MSDSRDSRRKNNQHKLSETEAQAQEDDQMKTYTLVSEIRKVLPTLKTCSDPGHSTDGQRVQIRYEACDKPTERAKLEAAVAKNSHLDLRVYTGILDRVFYTWGINPQLCITMLVMERVDLESRKYGYRTFNLNRGRIRHLKVI